MCESKGVIESILEVPDFDAEMEALEFVSVCRDIRFDDRVRRNYKTHSFIKIEQSPFGHYRMEPSDCCVDCGASKKHADMQRCPGTMAAGTGEGNKDG